MSVDVQCAVIRFMVLHKKALKNIHEELVATLKGKLYIILSV